MRELRIVQQIQCPSPVLCRSNVFGWVGTYQGVSQGEENEGPGSTTSANANPHFSSILMPVFEGPDFAFEAQM